MKVNNPYQDSLAGLEIADPVRAFFDWCIEREAIRVRREAGQPPPWSLDQVFQKGRFLNLFREDDKGTQAVLRLLQPLSDPRRIEAAVEHGVDAHGVPGHRVVDGERETFREAAVLTENYLVNTSINL